MDHSSNNTYIFSTFFRISTSLSTVGSSKSCTLKLLFLRGMPHSGQFPAPLTNSKSTQLSHLFREKQNITFKLVFKCTRLQIVFLFMFWCREGVCLGGLFEGWKISHCYLKSYKKSWKNVHFHLEVTLQMQVFQGIPIWFTKLNKFTN